MTNFRKVLFYLFFFIFPLGILTSYDVRIFRNVITLVPLDIITLIMVTVTLLSEKKLLGRVLNLFGPIIFVSTISFAIKFENSYSLSQLAIALLYLVRLISYLIFPLTLVSIIKTPEEKNKVLYMLLCITFAVSFIGLYQYTLFPDLRTLKYVGWDDHLNRLVSSFLDPAFTGLILTFGLLTGIKLALDRKISLLILYPVISMLFIALLLTYSRSSYLAFLAGAGLLLLKHKLLKAFISLFGVFLLFVFTLPRGEGYGVILTRTHSIYAKIADSSTGFHIFSENPLFGTGYNNLCWEKVRWGSLDSQLHSCFGLDFLPILLLATFGVAGTLILIHAAAKYSGMFDKRSKYLILFKAIFISTLVHSLFTNSLFYPWVMGYLGVMGALVLANSSRVKINRK